MGSVRYTQQPHDQDTQHQLHRWPVYRVYDADSERMPPHVRRSWQLRTANTLIK